MLIQSKIGILSHITPWRLHMVTCYILVPFLASSLPCLSYLASSITMIIIIVCLYISSIDFFNWRPIYFANLLRFHCATCSWPNDTFNARNGSICSQHVGSSLVVDGLASVSSISLSPSLNCCFPLTCRTDLPVRIITTCTDTVCSPIHRKSVNR